MTLGRQRNLFLVERYLNPEILSKGVSDRAQGLGPHAELR